MTRASQPIVFELSPVCAKIQTGLVSVHMPARLVKRSVEAMLSLLRSLYGYLFWLTLLALFCT